MVRQSINPLRIHDRLVIPHEELRFSASRGGGPGGQHVNKVSSRIILRFDVTGSPSLSVSQKRLIRKRLSTRISRAGELRVVCGRQRSQAANRREAAERFVTLLRAALKRQKPRIASRIPKNQRRQRLEAKRHRGQVKQRRGRPRQEDDA